MAPEVALEERDQESAENARGHQRRGAHERETDFAQPAVDASAEEGGGVTLLYLPPCSPDFNSIEKAFSKLEALLRKAAERTVERRPLEQNRRASLRLHAERMRQLLRRRRL